MSVCNLYDGYYFSYHYIWKKNYLKLIPYLFKNVNLDCLSVVYMMLIDLISFMSVKKIPKNLPILKYKFEESGCNLYDAYYLHYLYA